MATVIGEDSGSGSDEPLTVALSARVSEFQDESYCKITG